MKYNAKVYHTGKQTGDNKNSLYISQRNIICTGVHKKEGSRYIYTTEHLNYFLFVRIFEHIKRSQVFFIFVNTHEHINYWQIIMYNTSYIPTKDVLVFQIFNFRMRPIKTILHVMEISLVISKVDTSRFNCS